MKRSALRGAQSRVTSMSMLPFVVSSRTTQTAGAGVLNCGASGFRSGDAGVCASAAAAITGMIQRVMTRTRATAGIVALAIAGVVLDAGPSRFGFSDRVERHLFPEVTTGPSEPAWSPDGQWIAFSMQGDIWKVPAAGGEAIALTKGPWYYFEPDWSPDGNSIAFTMDTGGNLDIGMVGANGGEVTRL